MSDSIDTAGRHIDDAARSSEKAQASSGDSNGNGTVDTSSIFHNRQLPASPMSDSDSEEGSVFSGPPPPSLPDVDGVEEIFRTPRPATFGDLAQRLTTLPKNEYDYGPLRQDDIRILELKKGEGEQFIECSLIPMRLSRHHRPKYSYQALSYVWGTDDPIHPIRILDAEPRQKQVPEFDKASGKWKAMAKKVLAHEYQNVRFRKFHVRENIYSALKEFRQKDQDLWLWVDAICINQKNTDEKSQQLSRIHDIYNKAYNVCIWLGQADDKGKSSRAINFIHKAVDLRLLDGLVSPTDSKTLLERATDWSCLTELMSSSWFSRRWVVQEVALARNASLHCGDAKIHWYNFADAVANFVTKLDQVRALYKKVNSSEFNPASLAFVEALGAKVMVETTSDLFRKSEDGEILERLLDLETLVSSLLTFDAGNPRDIIYALLSLARDSPLVKPPPRSQVSDSRDLLRPDYGKHAIEVYTDFVNHCIKSGSLDIICRHWAVPFRRELKHDFPDSTKQKFLPLVKLPSWIGLLEDSPFGPPSRLTGRVNADSLVGTPNKRRYNASGGEKPVAHFETKGQKDQNGNASASSPSQSTPNPLKRKAQAMEEVPEKSLSEFDVTLCCKGLKLATVTKLSPRMVNATIPKECLDMGGWGKDEKDKLPNRVPDKLWRTLCADRGPDGQNPPSWYHRACLHCLATTSPSGDINTGELILDENSPELMVRYLKRVQSVVWSRMVLQATSIRNRDEQIFGLASQKTEVDDLVCILFGCTVPVILRERYDQVHGLYHEFIGESYIHGKMDGEAFSGLSQADLDSRTMSFNLR